VAIQYPGTPYELSGCVTDAQELRKLLEEEDFGNECITVLSDARGAKEQPTRQNILKWCKWLVQDAKEGDTLVFHFSGHGHQLPDETGVEDDGMDEAILTSDFQYVIDDELWNVLVQPLPNGVALTALMDCCHSGTGLDLPYSWEHGRWVEDHHPSHSQGDVRLFSACADSGQIADGEQNQLTLTKAFVRSYRKGRGGEGARTTMERGVTFKEFMSDLRLEMASSGQEQEPQLSASQDFDMGGLFSLIDFISPNRNALVGHLWKPLQHSSEGPYGQFQHSYLNTVNTLICFSRIWTTE